MTTIAPIWGLPGTFLFSVNVDVRQTTAWKYTVIMDSTLYHFVFCRVPTLTPGGRRQEVVRNNEILMQFSLAMANATLRRKLKADFIFSSYLISFSFAYLYFLSCLSFRLPLCSSGAGHRYLQRPLLYRVLKSYSAPNGLFKVLSRTHAMHH